MHSPQDCKFIYRICPKKIIMNVLKDIAMKMFMVEFFIILNLLNV